MATHSMICWVLRAHCFVMLEDDVLQHASYFRHSSASDESCDDDL